MKDEQILDTLYRLIDERGSVTAWDVTRELHSIDDVPHGHVRAFIHGSFTNGKLPGLTRNTVTVGNGETAFAYSRKPTVFQKIRDLLPW